MLAHEAAMALENARLYDKVRHQAFHDALTGLPNRLLFRDRVEAALGASGRAGAIAILFIDLDAFKEVNDRSATPAATPSCPGRERLAASMRDGDVAARLGGDEFAVLARGRPGGRRRAAAIASRLLDAFRRPFDLGDASADIDASIGVATTGRTGHAGRPAAQRRRRDVRRQGQAPRRHASSSVRPSGRSRPLAGDGVATARGGHA